MRLLEEDEIEEILVRRGVGVLAMVDDNTPYAIPISFGYDSSGMVFPMQWGGGYDSRKNKIIDENPNVCLTVYEQDANDEAVWRSLVITGELHEIDQENQERAYAALAANAEFPPDLGVWGIPLEDVDFRLLGLSIDECTGREFAAEYSG